MKIKKLLFVFLPLFFFNVAFATTYHVGPSRTYATPNALFLANVIQNGDMIEIDAADYIGVAAFANWSADNLIIKGVGGRPHLIANGLNLQGKGIWIISGDNAIVENIEFSGATVPDQNGAGIRQEGISLTIRNCYFHDNENGILTNNPNAGDILVEFSEFSSNGFGDGFTHNIYVGHVNSFILRYSYMHHAKVGHNVKSRATNNYILYNRIMDEATGNSSRLIDLSNGGFAIVMGNLLMQGPNAPNNNLVGFGPEGLSNTAPHELHFINNTLVNKRTSCVFVSIQGGTSIANISNNIFAGIGTLVNGSTTTMNNNISDTSITNMLFTDEIIYDYHLTTNSPAVNSGTSISAVNGFSLTPEKQYIHPINNASRALVGTIDVGAYEYEGTLSSDEFSLTQFVIYPNPATEKISIMVLDIKDLKVSIYNNVGQKIDFQESFSDGNYSIDTSDFAAGIYFVEVRIDNQKKIVKIIIE